VTGAAGAIGSGICRGLLEQGCHVAATDLPGENLDSLTGNWECLRAPHPGVPLDVTIRLRSLRHLRRSAAGGRSGPRGGECRRGTRLFARGNEPGCFRRLEKVNTEGTLLILGAAGRHFRAQGTGGDIVLISTKNVFAPGPCSAPTAHQERFPPAGADCEPGIQRYRRARQHGCARCRVLERHAQVGIVGGGRSGRMRSKGLNAEQLEEHYAAEISSRPHHGAPRGQCGPVLRDTPDPDNRGTIPVDGGLPMPHQGRPRPPRLSQN